MLVGVLSVVLSIGVLLGRTAVGDHPTADAPRFPEGGLVDPPPPVLAPSLPATRTPGRAQPNASGTATVSPGRDVTARYIVHTSWHDGLVVGIEVTNHSRRSQPWSVKVVHRRSDGVRVKDLWNAELAQDDATTNVFTGGDLAPGATLTFGFTAAKRVDGTVRPTTCVVGRRTPCRVG